MKSIKYVFAQFNATYATPGLKPNNKTDIWSFGATALEILTAEDPWAVGEENLEVVLERKMTAKTQPIELFCWIKWTKICMKRCQRCWFTIPTASPQPKNWLPCLHFKQQVLLET